MYVVCFNAMSALCDRCWRSISVAGQTHTGTGRGRGRGSPRPGGGALRRWSLTRAARARPRAAGPGTTPATSTTRAADTGTAAVLAKVL